MMAARLVVRSAAAVFFAVSVIAKTNNSSTCRYIPGDDGWPVRSDWAQLNQTVGGRLIATDPLAHVCHTPTVDKAACDVLKTPIDWHGAPPLYVTRLNLTLTQWDQSETYIGKPAETMDTYYQNQSCDPFTSTSRPCELGNLAVYSIDVTGANDVIAGMQFAQRKNVRLSIHNTGHDYNCKSCGLGSLSLWTYNLKTTEFIPKYESSYYSGPAAKFGAGMGLGESLLFVSQHGHKLVTGECGTVGIAGGYSQGGGHGVLNGAYGMAADNVLEWELVTGEGEHLIATPEQHADLYWALSGGGGGTYGVVLSMKAKVHPEGPVTGPVLTFTAPNVGNETYWRAVEIFYKHLPTIVKGTSNSIQFTFWNNNFGALFAFLDQQTSSVINSTMRPLLAELDQIGIPYNITTEKTSTYKDYYNINYGPLPYGLESPSTTLTSRIVPEWVVVDSDANAKLVAAAKLTTESGLFQVDCTSSDFNRSSHPDNAVLPAWREAIVACNLLAFWDWHAPLSKNLQVKSTMVDVYAPAWDAATPGSGVYLNEVDSSYKGDFKQTMYGANYPRLLNIKHQHDPHHLFYGHFTVGSDEFTTDGSGRLCYDGL